MMDKQVTAGHTPRAGSEYSMCFKSPAAFALQYYVIHVYAHFGWSTLHLGQVTDIFFDF